MAWTDWMQPEPTHDVHGLMKQKAGAITTPKGWRLTTLSKRADPEASCWLPP